DMGCAVLGVLQRAQARRRGADPVARGGSGMTGRWLAAIAALVFTLSVPAAEAEAQSNPRLFHERYVLCPERPERPTAPPAPTAPVLIPIAKGSPPSPLRMAPLV